MTAGSTPRIVLVNMPFAAAERPSLGLTAIRSALREKLHGQVLVECFYPNLDFARRLGVRRYDQISQGRYYSIGLGDWLFREQAFPDGDSDSEEYLLRCFPDRWRERGEVRELADEVREWLGGWLDDLVARAELETATVVGFTSVFQQNVASLALARRLKACKPAPTVVMGGANCEFPMGPTLAQAFDSLDLVFSGPALESFPNFVRGLLGGRSTDELAMTGGVFRRTSGPDLVRQDLPTQGAERPINNPVDLDYDDWLDEFYRTFPNRELIPSLTFETARGCWWGERRHCTFCGLNPETMGYRAMSPELALEQFDRLFRYASRCSMFECVDDIVAKSYFQDVFPWLKPPEGATIFYEVKASLSDDQVATLSRAGVRVIQPGVESLATASLRLMGKGTTAFQNISLLKSCVRHGVHPTWNLLIGFPGEDEAVYRKYLRDIPLLAHLGPPSGVYPVRFDRFSPYFSDAASYGLELAPSEHYGFIYPVDQEALAGLAYHFVDRARTREHAARLAWWAGRLGEAVRVWRDQWFVGEEATFAPEREPFEGELLYRPPYRSPRPRLEWENGTGHGRTVRDSRTGQERESVLTPFDATVLRLLDGPADERRLSALTGAEPAQVAAALARLSAAGLVFAENGRHLSLVVG